MKKIKFDCNTNNAPAYSCSEPNDNSGYYYQSTDVDELLKKIWYAAETMPAIKYMIEDAINPSLTDKVNE